MFKPAIFIGLLLSFPFALDKALAENIIPLESSNPPYATEPSPGSIWVEPKTGMEFLWIPSGCFQMGSGKYKNEQPVHKVCVTGFWMGRYEITQAQYVKIMGNNPSKFSGLSNPVENVTWDDASDFAEEMSYITDAKVRLPSEAEWEYACRAGNSHNEYCGKGGHPGKMAWYNENSNNTIHPVGLLAQNDWGLFDMSGNAEEWTLDCEHDDYVGAPTNGRAWLSGSHDDQDESIAINAKIMSGICDWHMLRGGGWKDDVSRSLRAASRRIGFAHDQNLSSGGFRIVRQRAELSLKLAPALR